MVPEAFIFTLTNIYNIEPTRFIRGNDEYGIFFNSNYGPWFGNSSSIGFISDYSKSNNCPCYFGVYTSYQDSLEKGRSIFTGDLNKNNVNYKINEIEAFKLYK